MRLERALSVLILADVGLSLISVAGADTGAEGWRNLLWLFVIGSTVAAWVGLSFRLAAARMLYLVSWLGYLALIALRDQAFAGGLEEAMQLLMALNGGAILAIAWLTDLRDRFVTLPQALGGTSA